MIEIEARLDELEQLGLSRRMRLVSGPQGPRVVLDGKPVLLLCSNNYLGLADHPAVREAAADAAMRWGVGAGGSRMVSGTMTIHRRLEERLAAFQRHQTALLFGSGYLANLGVVSALARPGDVVFSDELNHAAVIDGCRLSGADVFIYEHGDVEHLEWGLREAEGRGALIVTDGVFARDGDVAPLPELVELAARWDVRLVVDDAHGVGTLGSGGRGSVAEAGCEDGVDVVIGSLGKALGSYGAYVACDQPMARYLATSSRSLIHSTAPSPPAVAGALAALTLLEQQPRRVEKLQANAVLLRAELAAAGFDVPGSAHSPIVTLALGDAATALRGCEKALERGVFAQPLLPPQVPLDGAGLRLAVMASHSKSELRDAARALAQAAKAAGAVQSEPTRAPQPVVVREPAPIAPGPRARHAELWDDGEGELWVEQRRPVRAAAAVQASGRVFDAELDGPPAPRASRRSQQMAQGIFDVEAPASVVEHAA
ncbi:MAG TPA: pyridoxal phosphate-dependent aminotransferase family protein [Conexibacter sp.]|nr:pyridoxal phosphate-dependent aminotransferase family protein [Conexibacter sp.]